MVYIDRFGCYRSHVIQYNGRPDHRLAVGYGLVYLAGD
jgi:hypothetical protein